MFSVYDHLDLKKNCNIRHYFMGFIDLSALKLIFLFDERKKRKEKEKTLSSWPCVSVINYIIKVIEFDVEISINKETQYN